MKLNPQTLINTSFSGTVHGITHFFTQLTDIHFRLSATTNDFCGKRKDSGIKEEEVPLSQSPYIFSYNHSAKIIICRQQKIVLHGQNYCHGKTRFRRWQIFVFAPPPLPFPLLSLLKKRKRIEKR